MLMSPVGEVSGLGYARLVVAGVLGNPYIPVNLASLNAFTCMIKVGVRVRVSQHVQCIGRVPNSQDATFPMTPSCMFLLLLQNG